jgi:hypothetical protein
MSRVFIAVAILALAGIVPPSAPAQEPPQPIIHLVVPSVETCGRYDPLPGEAALRLLAVDLAARAGLAARYWPVDQADLIPPDAYPRILLEYREITATRTPEAAAEPDAAPKEEDPQVGIHEISAFLERAPEQRTLIAKETMTFLPWDDMLNRIDRLESSMWKAAARELHFDVDKMPNSAAPAPAQLAALSEARAAALNLSPRAILDASSRVDGVLNESPLCAPAHRTAALCAALLACQDLRAPFRESGRFLAGPLSHLMMARRLDPREAASTDAAFLMLACGYPGDALRVVESLPEEQRDTAAARALRMFATRDYRPLEETLMDASPVEQIAWLWAVQDCSRSDLLADAPGEMAMAHGNPAFLPVYERAEIGPSHSYTIIAMNLAYALDAQTLLSEGRLPEAQRSRLVRRVADALAPGFDADLFDILRSVIKKAEFNFVEERLVPAGSALMEVYSAAMRQPAGPVLPDLPIRWRTLPLHDFAEWQRGAFLVALYWRITFLGTGLAIPEAAEDLSGQAAEALSESGLGSFWGVLKAGYHAPKEALAPAAEFPKTPMGKRSPNLRWLLAMLRYWHNREAGKEAEWHPEGRGSFEWSKLGWNADYYGYGPDSARYLAACKAADPFEITVFTVPGDADACLALAERMPYHADLVFRTADFALKAERAEDAAHLLLNWVAAHPRDHEGYDKLCHTYLKMGTRFKAVETAIRAADQCPFSVGLSNLEGELAYWLVWENRPEEALTWGKEAARSGSEMGLLGLARSLEANGDADAAREIHRDNAERYDDYRPFLRFLIRRKATPAEISQELTAFVPEDPEQQKAFASTIGVDLQQLGADTLIMERAFEGPLSAILPERRPIWLFHAALYARDFTRASQYSAKAQEIKRQGSHFVLASLLAKSFVYRDDQWTLFDEYMRKTLKKPVGQGGYHDPWFYQYLIGEISREELLESAKTPADRARAFWVIGVWAERAGDFQAAIAAYGEGADVNVVSHERSLCRNWKAALETLYNGKEEDEGY